MKERVKDAGLLYEWEKDHMKPAHCQWLNHENTCQPYVFVSAYLVFPAVYLYFSSCISTKGKSYQVRPSRVHQSEADQARPVANAVSDFDNWTHSPNNSLPRSDSRTHIFHSHFPPKLFRHNFWQFKEREVVSKADSFIWKSKSLNVSPTYELCFITHTLGWYTVDSLCGQYLSFII